MPQGYTEAAAEITDTPGKKRKKKNKTKKNHLLGPLETEAMFVWFLFLL